MRAIPTHLLACQVHSTQPSRSTTRQCSWCIPAFITSTLIQKSSKPVRYSPVCRSLPRFHRPIAPALSTQALPFALSSTARYVRKSATPMRHYTSAPTSSDARRHFLQSLLVAAESISAFSGDSTPVQDLESTPLGLPRPYSTAFRDFRLCSAVAGDALRGRGNTSFN